LRAAANEEGSDEDGPSIQQILPRVYERLAAIMIPALLILALDSFCCTGEATSADEPG